MDYVAQVRLGQLLQALDAAVERNDRIAAMLLTDQINQILLSNKPTLADSSSMPSLPGLPVWVRTLIRDRGLRVPALEKALGASKVVIGPMMGGDSKLAVSPTERRYGLQITINF